MCVEKKWGGQRGIVSCIAMLPACTDTYAVGSYSGQGESVSPDLTSHQLSVCVCVISWCVLYGE